ncbi:nuclear receptor-binding protein 2-like [Carcharodon carcharias]|uniref:nuclear receptor-binding protein 2-like n=1 Tax=Carcharodon carcharias TaxID=13397 RepID=UPI001B7F665A|nr:nuclear receptor-binding protein 2-like [Carcharodon carcharias]
MLSSYQSAPIAGAFSVATLLPIRVHLATNQHPFHIQYKLLFSPCIDILTKCPDEFQVKDTTALDIFAFGICALEMAVLEVQRNAENNVSPNSIVNATQSLENPLMKEFIQKCLARDPLQRPSAHDLLFHQVLFEVHSLKLLAAHTFINNQYLMQDNCVEEMTKRINGSAVMAEIQHRDRAGVQWRYSHVSTLELDKFLEDVKNGIHPLMNFSSHRPHHLFWAPHHPPETAESVKSPVPEAHEQETRKVIQMQCQLELHEDNMRWHLTLFLKLDDRLHRHLTCDLLPTPGELHYRPRRTPLPTPANSATDPSELHYRPRRTPLLTPANSTTDPRELHYRPPTNSSTDPWLIPLPTPGELHYRTWRTPLPTPVNSATDPGEPRYRPRRTPLPTPANSTTDPGELRYRPRRTPLPTPANSATDPQ